MNSKSFLSHCVLSKTADIAGIIAISTLLLMPAHAQEATTAETTEEAETEVESITDSIRAADQAKQGIRADSNKTVDKKETVKDADKSKEQAQSDGNKDKAEPTNRKETPSADLFDANQADPLPEVKIQKSTKPKETVDSTKNHSKSELSAANEALLAENAKLQRDMNDLETQVDVLTEERSGQIFLFAAITSLVSFIVGSLFAVLLFGRRRESRY